MDALQQPGPRSSKILLFDGVMGKRRKSQPPPEPAPALKPALTWWQRNKETVNVVCTIVAVLTALISVVSSISWHNAATRSATTDEHVNQLIDNKLGPIYQQLERLNAQVSDALGQLKRIDARVHSLKPDDPKLQAKNSSAGGDVLAGITANLAKADKHRQQLPLFKLVNY